jgi:hypothetical protein
LLYVHSCEWRHQGGLGLGRGEDMRGFRRKSFAAIYLPVFPSTPDRAPTAWVKAGRVSELSLTVAADLPVSSAEPNRPKLG